MKGQAGSREKQTKPRARKLYMRPPYIIPLFRKESFLRQAPNPQVELIPVIAKTCGMHYLRGNCSPDLDEHAGMRPDLVPRYDLNSLGSHLA